MRRLPEQGVREQLGGGLQGDGELGGREEQSSRTWGARGFLGPWGSRAGHSGQKVLLCQEGAQLARAHRAA